MSKQLLRQTALFGGLSDAQLDEVLSRCEDRRYEAGETVVTEGEEGDEMFILRQGRVAVSKAVRFEIPGRGEISFEKQLIELTEGDYFGEVALLASDTRSATVKALTALDVWVLKLEPMQQLMAKDNDLGYRLVSVMSRELCKRLHRANEDIKKLLTAFAIAINR